MQKRNRKDSLANRAIDTPTWYAYCDLRPVNVVGPVVTAT